MATKSVNETTQEEVSPQIPPKTDMTFQIISLDLIDDPEAPMRSDMTEASVEDLVMSIKQVGIIEPLVVKEQHGRYEVIAGHRRLFASRVAKCVDAPCYVRTANDEQTEMLKIHENLYRAEVSPTDEAKHYSYLVTKQKMTPTKIAQLIHKSLSYVLDRLSILEYPDFLAEAMTTGAISFSVAREFSHIEDLAQMKQSVYYAKRSGMTQELARKWVQDIKRAKETPQVRETSQYNPQNGVQEIVHTVNCVYCHEGMKLTEADVVYIHPKCLQEASSVVEQ